MEKKGKKKKMLLASMRQDERKPNTTIRGKEDGGLMMRFGSSLRNGRIAKENDGLTLCSSASTASSTPLSSKSTRDDSITSSMICEYTAPTFWFDMAAVDVREEEEEWRLGRSDCAGKTGDTVRQVSGLWTAVFEFAISLYDFFLGTFPRDIRVTAQKS